MDIFLPFLGVSAVVIATPGPDTAITIRNTLLGGRTGGVFTALGIASGQTIWALAASGGITALLIASEPLFDAVKYAGAAYLAYLGVQSLMAALRPSLQGQQDIHASGRPPRVSPLRAFKQGVISDIGNPKMAVFFASLLPQFVPAGAPTFTALLLLGLVFAAMTFSWLTLYAIVIAKTGDFIRRSSIRRTIEGVTGAVLIGLGLRIAAEQR